MKISKGVKASFAYVICSLLSKGLSIITLPLFTRLMPTDQMGIVNLYSSWYSMIGAFATLSLTSGGYMLAMKEFKDKRDEYMSSMLSLTSIVALFLTLIFVFFQQNIENFLGLPVSLIYLMLFGFIVSPATDFWLARQRYEYKYIKAGIIIVLSSVLASAISIIAVIIASHYNIESIATVKLFSTNFIAYGVSLTLWILIMLRGKKYIDVDYWKYSLKLSIPLIGHSISMQILNASDRAMISKLVGNDKLGIYGVLYSVSSLSLIIWGAINSSFIPFLFDNIEKKEQNENIKTTSTILMLAYGIAVVLMTLIAPEIVKILATDEYMEAIFIMPPIAAGVFFTSIYNMYSNILIYYKKTHYIMISTVIAAIINIVLNVICIRKWGYMAAAYTTLVSYIILAIIEAVVVNLVLKKLNGSNYTKVYNGRILFIISLGTLFISMSSLLLYSSNIIRYIVIVLLAFAGLVLYNMKGNEIKKFVSNKE